MNKVVFDNNNNNNNKECNVCMYVSIVLRGENSCFYLF